MTSKMIVRASLVATGALTAAVLAGTAAQAATGGPENPNPGMQRMQQPMQEERNPGMQRMQQPMQEERNPGMQRMHELMQKGNPGMQRMHQQMQEGINGMPGMPMGPATR